MLTRIIPSTGESLPAIGIGTWQSFDVAPNEYASRKEVLTVMHQYGGRLIDSSPMYGRSEAVIGNLTDTLPQKNKFFYATKVWTQGAEAGQKQIEDSYRLMKREVMDLVQIHNLVDWQTHLAYLRKLKEEGRLRYIGITHYQDSSHEALASVIKKEKIDFVQFNYSIVSRHAEKILLPLCADKGIATLINRPFGEGALFKKVANKALPSWTKEWKIESWSAYFLKYILAHEAATCAIPATGNVQHAIENYKAGDGLLPDKEGLQKMIDYVEA